MGLRIKALAEEILRFGVESGSTRWRDVDLVLQPTLFGRGNKVGSGGGGSRSVFHMMILMVYLFYFIRAINNINPSL